MSVQLRKSGRLHGEVFTALPVVQFVLDEVDYKATENLSQVSILEPAAGNGAFALEIVRRLAQSAHNFGFNFIDALQNRATFVEVNPASYEALCIQIQDAITQQGYDSKMVNLSQVVRHGNYLQMSFSGQFNCVVGNPPYIRHEVISDDDKKLYRDKFFTFKHRADLYIPFYEHALKSLAPKGKLSFICSNRWLYNQYGQHLRDYIAREFHIAKLINIEKATLFDETVTAYPCITTITRSKQATTLYYQSNSKTISFQNMPLRQIVPPESSSWQSLFVAYDMNNIALSAITDQGYNISIGVATGADKVFIGSAEAFCGIEQDRLLPLIQSKGLRGDSIAWDGHFVINPFMHGRLCNLNAFPGLEKYLLAYKAQLTSRYIAKKFPGKWYATIDKIKPSIVKTPKLLLPDLAGCKYLLIDEGQYYPHHNVYYITHPSIDALKVLACLLMSSFIKDQLSQIGIRMNHGLPRLQAQTLKKLRIPKIDTFNSATIRQLIQAYDSQALVEIDAIVNSYCADQHIYWKKGA